jgi:hypothetical protein
MKKITFIILILAIASSVYAQSKSYNILREKFRGHESIAISTSGFLARTILRMAGEHEYTDAVKEIRNIRLMVISKGAFRAQNVSLKGFLKVAKADNFEELVHVRDSGDEVTLLLQSGKKNDDYRYLLLVDGGDEVVAMEIRGYIDYELLLKDKEKIAYQY